MRLCLVKLCCCFCLSYGHCHSLAALACYILAPNVRKVFRKTSGKEHLDWRLAVILGLALKDRHTRATSSKLPSLKLTASPSKWMVGILVPFWDGLLSGAMLVSGRVNSESLDFLEFSPTLKPWFLCFFHFYRLWHYFPIT